MAAASEPPPYRPGLTAVFDVARRLRGPGGCPWDQEQTHSSLRPYLLEETYEVLEAIDAEDDARLLEELGDLLLQVAMHSAIAEEQGRFTAESVSEAAAAKMVSRHPHVYADVEVASAADVLRNWERLKAAEHEGAEARPSPVDRVPKAMPALAWVHGMQKRAARVGADFGDPSGDATELVRLAERLRDPAEVGNAESLIGDLLFTAVSIARRVRVNPEDALRNAGQEFAARFRRFERLAAEIGRDLHELEPSRRAELWERAGGAGSSAGDPAF